MYSARIEGIMRETYDIIINRGPDQAFETLSLEKKDFLRHAATLIKEPKRIFLGLGDFLEIGDYSKMMDSVFFNEEGVKFENILDSNNRRIASSGNVPFSFFKLAVYYPDFLLKDVPTSCISAIGEKARLFPGAENFIKNIKKYEPIVLTAMPHEIAIELVKRVGLNEQNLLATSYKTKKDRLNRDVYAGDIHRFISGNRKSLEIEKDMNELGLSDEDIVYIGRGEAGMNTFSTVNSIAFNPSKNIIQESRITLYGSSLESLLVLFNFDGSLTRHLSSEIAEGFLPSLIVCSDSKDKSEELIELELSHLRLEGNILGQRIEHSGESYESVERDVEVAFAGSSININEVKNSITERMMAYQSKPQDLVKKIYDIAKVRYKNFFRVPGAPPGTN